MTFSNASKSEINSRGMRTLTWAVFIAAVASAFLHACWNVLAKLHSAPRDLLRGIVLATASLCCILLPFVGLPPSDTWLWVVAASTCNVAFTQAMLQAYACANFGITYVVVRAVIPPILFLIGWIFMNESGGLHAVEGLALVVLSLLLFAFSGQTICDWASGGMLPAISAGGALAFALLFDVNGIRACGGGFTCLIPYAVASSVVTAIGLGLVSGIGRTNPFAVLRSHAKLCYAGAALLLSSYLCGMWAYVHGPIGLVAPLRESGIVFGGALAVLVLREPVSRLQWMAVGLATIGVVLVQVG
jgi:drug/metabolite transporter (DMT)-like permease